MRGSMEANVIEPPMGICSILMYESANESAMLMAAKVIARVPKPLVLSVIKETTMIIAVSAMALM